MLIELKDTSTSEISSRLRQVTSERGELTSDRVLTLILVASIYDDIADRMDSLQTGVAEHPARIIVVALDPENTTGDNHGDYALDGTIEVGMRTGAAEIVTLILHGEIADYPQSVITPLLLPDTPVVVWWPFHAPEDMSSDPIGRLATRRISDTFSEPSALQSRREFYHPGDSDLSWSRITLWRGQVAASIEQPPYEDILSATVSGPAEDPAVDIAAGWLAYRLNVPVYRISSGDDRYVLDDSGKPTIGIQHLKLERKTSTLEMRTVDSERLEVTITENNGEEPRVMPVMVKRRDRNDCMAEELRHLEADKTYGRALEYLDRVRYENIDQ